MKTMKQGVKITRKEEKNIINKYNATSTTLGGAIKALKSNATREDVRGFFHIENDLRIPKEKEELFWHVLTKCDLFHIAKEYLEKVNGVYCKKVTYAVNDMLHPENNYNKITGENVTRATITPLSGGNYKPAGYGAKIVRYNIDNAQKTFIDLIAPNKDNTKITFKCYVQLEKFTPVMIIRAIISYINAGCPEIAPVKPRAKKAKKETAPSQTGENVTA